MNLRKEWPVFALLAVIAAFGLVIWYHGVTYKAKFRPSYACSTEARGVEQGHACGR